MVALLLFLQNREIALRGGSAYQHYRHCTPQV
jgi:hypothetical protein